MKIIIDMPTPELQKAAENKVDDWTKQWGTLSIDQIWQRERDLMSFAFTASESAADRAVQVAIQKLSGEQKAELQDNIGKGSLLGTLFTGIVNKYLPLPV